MLGPRGSRNVARVNRPSLIVALALGVGGGLACGGGGDVEGKGGFHFAATGAGGAGMGGAGGSTGSSSTGAGGGSCHEGEACTVSGKLGACAAGTTACGPKGATCTGPAPAKETCNGADDDCNGATDETCAVTVEVRHFDGTSTGVLTTTGFPVGGKASRGT